MQLNGWILLCLTEYLIAKANAFNKAYNEGKDFDNTGLKLNY